MKDLNSFLSRSLRWIGFEAISYQLILLTHQLVLFKVTDYGTYGLIGAIFSLVYLSISIADFGLESSISPFFSRISLNGNLFRRFFIIQLIPNIIFVISLFCGLFFLKNLFILRSISTSMFFLLAGLILVETVKKTLRTAMHLAFLNVEVAFIEVATILIYTASIWVAYFSGFVISLSLIFIPMFVTSVISTILMIVLLIIFSLRLPEKNIENLSVIRIVKSRFCNFLNQFCHSLFSSNFLVPFFAIQFGFAQAGVFKFISHVAYGVTSIVRKTFGLTSDALFAKAKDMSFEANKAIFLRVTQRLNHALYGIVIFFIINHEKLLAKSGAVDLIGAPIIYLFLFICLSENFFIAYEKFYIIQEQTVRLLAFNLLTMAFIYGLVSYVAGLSQLFALIAIIVVRVIMFVILGAVSFYTWNIKPQWKLQPKYLAFALFLSLGFFIIF